MDVDAELLLDDVIWRCCGRNAHQSLSLSRRWFSGDAWVWKLVRSTSGDILCDSWGNAAAIPLGIVRRQVGALWSHGNEMH